MRKLQVPAILSLILILGATGAAVADEHSEISGDVRLTLKIVNGEPGREDTTRTYQMVVTPGGNPVHLTQGFRVPIPTTSFNTQDADGGNIVPVTSFSYQNVGFMAKMRVSLLPQGRIHIRGSVEDSSLSNREGTMGRPMIATVDQSLEITLKNGATTRVSWVENSGFGSMFLEITAEILD